MGKAVVKGEMRMVRRRTKEAHDFCGAITVVVLVVDLYKWLEMVRCDYTKQIRKCNLLLRYNH
jgi:hypothetical protein